MCLVFLENGLKNEKRKRMSKQEDSPATLNITNKEGSRQKTFVKGALYTVCV